MLENVPYPRIVEVSSEAGIKAIDTSSATAYWFVRAIMTQDNAIFRWDPASTLADAPASGVLKPTAVGSTSPGRWIFQRWETSYAATLTAPIDPYQEWSTGELELNDVQKIVTFTGSGAGTLKIMLGTKLQPGNSRYVILSGSGSLVITSEDGVTVQDPLGATLDGQFAIAMVTYLGSETYVISGQVTP